MYDDENIILCASNSYNRKYFFNNDFTSLPDTVKQELNILAVLFTEDVGGSLIIEFNCDGNLILKTQVNDNDFFYDEIGSALKIKEMRKKHRELFEALELYYKTFFN